MHSAYCEAGGRSRHAAAKALNTATRAGTEISVSPVARAAGVDRTFLYRHRDLLTQIHTAQTLIGGSAGAKKPCIAQLDQQVIALGADIAGREEQLEAAREANRDLIEQLNR